EPAIFAWWGRALCQQGQRQRRAALVEESEDYPAQPEKTKGHSGRGQSEHDLVEAAPVRIDRIGNTNDRIGSTHRFIVAQREVPSLRARRSSKSFDRASTAVMMRKRMSPSSSRADFCMPPASLNSLASAEAIEFEGEKIELGKLTALPITK